MNDSRCCCFFLGDDCEFLHEYDMAKMPECYFFSRFGQCMNKECAFLHLDPESKIRGRHFFTLTPLTLNVHRLSMV